MADVVDKSVENKQPARGADIMEGAARAKNNRDYTEAVGQLKNSFNPKSVRELDSAAYEFCDHHVFKAVTNDKGEKTGQIIIVYYAGEHCSNIDLAFIAELEKDTATQEQGKKGLEKAGYIVTAEEPDTEAKVLS